MPGDARDQTPPGTRAPPTPSTLNIGVVQGLLGHRSISTTEIYLRPAALEDLKKAVDRDYRVERFDIAAGDVETTTEVELTNFGGAA